MSREDTNFYISVKSIDDLLRCLCLASLLELVGWPKPGNIHRRKDFEKTRFEHFIAGIAAIQPNFKVFCEYNFQKSFNNEDDYKTIELGHFFKKAAEEMIRWQGGGNVILGHILILAPLAAAALICIRKNQNNIKDLKYHLNKVIGNASVDDTLNLYQAIRIANPGGLGKIKKYDINDEDSFNQLIKDKIKLKKVFELSKEYDLISLEYSSGFNIILNEGFPFFVKNFNQFNDINIATVNTYLKILSLHQDTLVIRKSGLDSALYISKMASNILENGGIASDKGLRLAIELDNELQKKKGELNPGTTADLVSGVIFCGLLFDIRF